MVNVRSIAEMGAYVYLLEYNNIEGMILLSELSRRRIRSINKLIRVGKTEPVVVIRVDKEKGDARPTITWVPPIYSKVIFSKTHATSGVSTEGGEGLSLSSYFSPNLQTSSPRPLN